MSLAIFDVHALPIKTMARKTLIPKGYYVGKAGIQFLNWQKEWEFLFGFSLCQDEQQAKQIAYYELLERLLARYEIQSKIRGNISDFTSVAWPSWKPSKDVNPGVIFIGRNPFSQTGVEAAGLALRQTLDEAAEHAIFELLERHLCAKIWYTKDVSLIRVDPGITFEQYVINFYTTNASGLPFVMAEVISEKCKTITFGHAIRRTFLEASHKARSEAFMLLDCLLHDDNGICSNERTKRRIFSLRRDLALTRHDYLQNKVTSYESCFPEGQFNCSQVVHKVLGESAISIIPLFQDDKICVVRAISPAVETLAACRYGGVPLTATDILDPFC
jgi:hypothetical protein